MVFVLQVCLAYNKKVSAELVDRGIPHARTFHSFAHRLMHEMYAHTGCYPKNWNVDQSKTQKLLQELYPPEPPSALTAASSLRKKKQYSADVAPLVAYITELVVLAKSQLLGNPGYACPALRTGFGSSSLCFSFIFFWGGGGASLSVECF